MTSDTNTFSSVLPGVSVTVSAVSTAPITLTVARDDTGISNAANSLVTSLNDIFTFISQKQAVTTGTDAAGGTTVTAGAFTGDSTVRDANQKLIDAVIAPINGVSPSTYGISITSDGQVTFDKTAFATALGLDPVTTTVDPATGRASRQPATPIHLDTAPAVHRTPPPLLGAHDAAWADAVSARTERTAP